MNLRIQGLRSNRRHNVRRGASIIYMMTALTGMTALMSLGVDYGRVQVARLEVSAVADAAARSAARSLPQGFAAARKNAVDLAAQNKVDGQPAAIDGASDVEFGTWDKAALAFKPLAAGASIDTVDAVRVTVGRTHARGNAIPLVFGTLVGAHACDAQASAVATFDGQPTGFIGLQGVTFKNNAFVGSYRSSEDVEPSKGLALSNALVGSNAVIGDKHNGLVKGVMLLGPAGSVNALPSTGSTVRLNAPIKTPVLPTWNPTPAATTLVVNGATTLPGGTYWFTSLTVNGSLDFSGPATVHVAGDIVCRGRMTAYQSKPVNLMIYQHGAHAFTDDGHNHFDLTAVVTAPHSHLEIKNNAKTDPTYNGAGLFATITVKNNGQFYYDEDLGPALGGRVKLVK